MKPGELMKILSSLGYRESRRSGSHPRMVCDNREPLTFSFHDGQTIPPGLVKKILEKDVGLTDTEIRTILSGKKIHKEPNDEEH